MYYTLTSFSHKFKQHSINHFLCEITVIVITIIAILIIIIIVVIIIIRGTATIVRSTATIVRGSVKNRKLQEVKYLTIKPHVKIQFVRYNCWL
jgi:uncharacterized membrane-anchored protein